MAALCHVRVRSVKLIENDELHQGCTGCTQLLPPQSPDPRKISGPHRRTKTIHTQNLNLIKINQLLRYRIRYILVHRVSTEKDMCFLPPANATHEPGSDRMQIITCSKFLSPSALATSIVNHPQRHSKISWKGGNGALPYYA